MINRIIFSDNGTLSDLSTSLDNYLGSTSVIPFVAAEDAIFIGLKFPINHLYFNSSVANDAASVASVAVWNGNEFTDVVELIDETSSAGVSLAQDGFMTWVPNKQNGWGRDDTVNSSGTERITGLGDITIYDSYWLKMTFSNDLNTLTALSWIGNLFSTDSDLEVEYPDLLNSAVLTGFKAAKANWFEQHVRAAELMMDDMVDQGVIVDKNQILERRQLRPAAICKVAEIIHNSFGQDGDEERRKARSEYAKRIAKRKFAVDTNSNAIEDRGEFEQLHSMVLRR